MGEKPTYIGAQPSFSPELVLRQQWLDAIWEKSKGLCAGCGSDERVKVRMVVPREAGGLYIPENGTTICRCCEVATEAVTKAKDGKKSVRRPINIWVSRALYNHLTMSLDSQSGFKSMGSLARYMMEMYVEAPSRFEDLEQFQDPGGDVKINLHVARDKYMEFRQTLLDRGLTVADGMRGLFLMYVTEGDPDRRVVKDA